MRPDSAARPLRNRKRRLLTSRSWVAAASGIAIVVLAGCSGAGGSNGAVSGTITIAAEPGVDDAPLYMALQNGTFKSDGLNVVIRSFGSASADLLAVEKGQAQIADTDYGNIFAGEQAESAGGNLSILANGYDAGAGSAEILVRPNSKLTRPTLLANIAIGMPDDLVLQGAADSLTSVTHPQSLIAAAATEVIGNYLAGAADTLRWQAMPQQQEMNELQDGKLQAALLTEPYLYDAESTFGATALVDAFSGETANLPLSGYVALSSWVKTNPSAVADFRSAISTAQTTSAMVGPVQQVLPKMPNFSGMTPAAAKMVSIGSYPTTTSISDLQRVLVLMTNERILPVNKPGSPNVKNMVAAG